MKRLAHNNMSTTIVRALMMVLGGALAGAGLATPEEAMDLVDQLTQLVGFGLAAAAAIWSIYKRWQATRTPVVD